MPVTNNEVALEAVRHLHEAWLAAELSGDVEGVLSLCTSDVRWLAPDSGMLVGREAGRHLLTDTHVELESIVASDLQVEISGDLAYKTSRYETHYRGLAQGKVQVARGTHVWILRREGAEWRVALVTWQAEQEGPPLLAV
jgi:ketosteroid isomerase-like protein